MKVTTRILARVVISVAIAGSGIGAIHHFEVRAVETSEARDLLRHRAQLLAELIERDLDRLEATVLDILEHPTLAQHLRSRRSLDLATADATRLAVEDHLLETAAGHASMVGIDIFDADGDRIVGVHNGERASGRSAISEGEHAVLMRSDRRTITWLRSGHARLMVAAADESACADSMIGCTFDFEALTQQSVQLALGDLAGTGMELLANHSTSTFQWGVPPWTFDVVSASAQADSFPATIEVLQRTDDALATFHRNQTTLIAVVAVVLLILIVLIWTAIRETVLKRILRIIEMVEAFEDERDIPPVRNKRNDELSRLEWTIHRTMQGWIESKRGLHNLAQSLETRITSRTDALRSQAEELRVARMAADLANQSKSDFLANMSHEIRTPMTAILGYADLLSDPARDRAVDADHVQIIRRNGEHLLTIINDILDLSKIEAGRMEVEDIPCSPWQLVRDVERLIQVRAREKGLTLRVEHEGLIPETIRTDPTRLRQILTNLIGNAIKFTDTGEVTLAFSLIDAPMAERPRMQFTVTDTGIGLTDEQVARLFQPFTQADTSTSRRFGGTGLGLAISKHLAEILGGGIEVESALGSGCRFSVTVGVGSLKGVRLLESPPEATFPTEPPSGQSSAEALSMRSSDNRAPVRILLAEDGPDNQRLISFVLQKSGFDVTVAENGRIALERVHEAVSRDEPFDIILMDMQMPEMDGYSATRTLRDAGYDRPIIALTAHAMMGDREKCLAAGCDDYATKPIDRTRLTETIREHLVPSGRAA